MRIDPNPFPENGVTPLFCSSLHPGTRERRWESFEGYHFDDAAVQPILRYWKGLRHTQGPLAGKEFLLAPEQLWLIREAFGWLRQVGAKDDGTPRYLRRFRIIFTEMGRGNGKSQLASGIVGYLLLADQEMNPEVVGVAATKPMARKYCLDRLRAMISANPSLDNLVDQFRHEIRRKEASKWGGVYEATSAEATSAWGGAPHGIAFDEVHAQPDRRLWDALETAMGKRAQPMMWGFTTAGWDRNSLCWEQHQHTMELANGTIEDEEYLGIIWSAPEDADWTDPDVWRSANPLLEDVEGSGLTKSGVPCAITIEFMRSKCKKAQSTPAFQNTFRTMYLSQWVGQETAFIDMQSWDQNDQSTLPKPGKRVAFGGLDLSSSIDLSGFAMVCRSGEKVELHVQLYAPEEGLVEREQRDKLPYRVWVREGWLKLTKGKTIDQEVIKQDIFRAMEEWDVKDISYDRWNASKLVRELEEEGVPMVQMGQGYASMSAPTKSLLQLTTDGNILAGGNQALRTQVSFTAATVDPAGNIKPDKSKSGARIDGVVAAIMGLDGLNRRGQERRKSAYEDEDTVGSGPPDVDNDKLFEDEAPRTSFKKSAYED